MPDSSIQHSSVVLKRDNFMRSLIRELSGVLQDVVGLDDAAGFISIVGQNMGESIDAEYRQALSVDKLSRDQVRDVLLDLKRRIEGQFYVLEEGVDHIVFGNHACPFGDKVIDRPSLCMMTSNVFGSIAAQNLGYARVSLDQTIAKGDAGCRVSLFLRADADEHGREYFRTE